MSGHNYWVSADCSGRCGKNLTWEYKNRVLTISGSGTMDDYGIQYFDYATGTYKYKDNASS